MTGGLTWKGGRLEGTAWQGIRYLSIAFPSGGPVRAVVTAHLNQVASNASQPANHVTRADVSVTGGRRITAPRYSVQVVSDTVVLSFEEFGDHSPYHVELRPLGNPQLTLHPFFRSAEFRFTITCEAGDCEQGDLEARAAPKQRPAIDLLTKDYNGFVRLLGNWVKVHNPHWADLSAASFERVLVELLAHQGDMLSYYQDRVANEAFVDTATQRFSLRQHALLLGTRLFDGCAATTVVAFDVSRPGHIPAGLEVRTAATPGEGAVVFGIDQRTPVHHENNSDVLRLAAFPGADDALVPAGASELLLWGSNAHLAAGGRLAFVQGSFSQVVTITEIQRVSEAGWVSDPGDEFDPGDPPNPVTRIRFREPLLAELAPWNREVPLRLHGNIASARHGERRKVQLESVQGASGSERVMRLSRHNSIVGHQLRGGSHVYQLRALQVPDAPVAHLADESGSAPMLEVRVGDEVWVRREHLHGSRSYDPHYTATADEDGSVWIGFGDGTRGREVEVERDVERSVDRPVLSIVLDYRIGDPVRGNVGLGTVREIVRPVTGTDEEAALSGLGRVTVVNVDAGLGGRPAQSLAQAREAIPMALRHGELERAVSLDDYARAAMQEPGVARAAARALRGVFNTVLVLIDPLGSEEASPELIERVHRRLDRLRMAGREHVVRGAKYVPLELSLLLCSRDGFPAHEVRERVLTELSPGTARRPGWFHPDRLTFGERVRLGDVLAFVQGLPGVRAVKATTFRRRGDRRDAVEDVIALGVSEVARLDADPNFPENGVLEVRMASSAEVAADDRARFTVDPVPAGGATS